MANNFTKAEEVMFEKLIPGFEDMFIMANNVDVYPVFSDQDMERTSDRFWVPQPYGAVTYNGMNQTGNFGDITQLSVPLTTSQHKSAPGTMTSKNLRDPLVLERYGKAAIQKLSSDVSFAILQTAALQGTVVSKRTGIATGFDDVAALAALFTERGVPMADRKAFYSSRDYLAMASSLAKPQTSGLGKTATAYEKATVGNIAGFDVYQNDQQFVLPARTAGMSAVVIGPLSYIPVGSTTDALGNTTNVDNRSQAGFTMTVTSGPVKVGDAFTIAGVNALDMITKQDTGQLQTFRVISIQSATSYTISPAIVPITAVDRASQQYANVNIAAPNGAAIVFLNTVTAAANPFFNQGAMALVPGSFAVDAADGWQVMRAKTSFGLGITYARQGAIDTFDVKYRWDLDFGVACLQPQMVGIQQFNQT